MIEILAPAGDLISLKSAIASDTDAVYLGLSAFNARIKAENFTTENIKDTVDYCHLFGVKVYVTINIAVKESEKEELKKIIVACGQANVDAFIITDMLALELAKERMQRSKEDTEYANSQYESDMSREKFYAEVDKQLK